MIREFLQWWAEQLLGLVPARLLLPGFGMVATLVARTSLGPGGEPAVELSRRRGRRETVLGCFAGDANGIRAAREVLRAQRRTRHVVLCLGPGTMMERAVVLPLAALEDPERVLRYEMERFTPFAADAVYWTWQMEQVDRINRHIHMRLALTPKAGLDDTIATLRDIGIAPATIEAHLDGGAMQSIPLDGSSSGLGRRHRKVTQATMAACGVLAVAAAVIPFVQQTAALDVVEAQIETLQPQVMKAEALRKRLASYASETDAMVAARAQYGHALRIIATITDILPDDTFLSGLTLSRDTVQLEGRSPGAARLIAALSATPSARNPHFTAPVIRGADGNDTFLIEVEFRP